MRRFTVLAPALIACAALSPATGQSRPGYRVIPQPTWSYKAEATDQGHLNVAKDPTKALAWVSLVSSETGPLADSGGYARQDPTLISITSMISGGPGAKRSGIGSDDAYLGGAGSAFPVRSAQASLTVEFANSNVTLMVDLTVQDSRVYVKNARYQAECDGETGFTELKHLTAWAKGLENGMPIPENGFLEIDVPNPGTRDSLATGEKNWRSRGSCSIGAGTPQYFDFQVQPADKSARVYLGGKYLGTAGEAFRIRSNPADVLVRKDGQPDLAKRVYLHEGPNYLVIR